MTADDLVRIEVALGIHLPVEYKVAMMSISVPVLRGNSTYPIFDDHNAIIEENRLLRRGGIGSRQWPNTMFCMGRGGDGWGYALDISSSPVRVHAIDRGLLDSQLNSIESDSCSVWFTKYFRDFREQLVDEGIDPDFSLPLTKSSFTDFMHGIAKILTFAVIVVLFVVLVGVLLAFLR